MWLEKRLILTVMSHLPALNVISGWIDMLVYVWMGAVEAGVDGGAACICGVRERGAGGGREHRPPEMR